MSRMIPTKSEQTAPVDATTAPSGAARPDNGTDGETVPGVGSLYSGVLVQRPNKSLLADEPDGAGNANPGTLPMVTRGARRTGRVLGALPHYSTETLQPRRFTMKSVFLATALLSTFNEPSPPTPPAPSPTTPIIQVQSSAADALRMAELQRKLDEAEVARKAALAESEAAKAKAAEVEKKLQEQQAAAAAQTSALEQFRAQQEELKARMAAQEAATEAAKVSEYRSKVIAAYLGQGVGIIEAMVQGATVDAINASAKAAAEEYARIQKMTLEKHKIPAATPQGVTTTPSAPAAPVVQAPSAVNPAPVPPEPNPLSPANIAAMSAEEYAKHRAQILQGLKSSGFSPEGQAWGFGYAPLHTARGAAPDAPAAPQQAPAPQGGGINHESVLGSVR